MWHRERSTRNALDKLLTDPPAAPPAAPPPQAMEPRPEAERPATMAPATSKATLAPTPVVKGSVLGPTLKFKGDLIADEDLVIQGRVEGSILHSRSLTIGQDGSMLGDIRARRVVIEGVVEGDLYALEGVQVRGTAEVNGSIFAPRVGVTEGAVFNGRVDMQHAPAIPQAIPAADAPEVEMTSAEIDTVLSATQGL